MQDDGQVYFGTDVPPEDQERLLKAELEAVQRASDKLAAVSCKAEVAAALQELCRGAATGL